MEQTNGEGKTHEQSNQVHTKVFNVSVEPVIPTHTDVCVVRRPTIRQSQKNTTEMSRERTERNRKLYVSKLLLADQNKGGLRFGTYT